MDNKSITRPLKLTGQLLELHEENPFKVKAFTNAAFKLSKYSEPLSEKTQEQLAEIEGVGKSVAAKIHELIQTGTIAELESLRSITPEGIIEMLSIKGLGPKKVRIIWKDLGIETIGELYYACNENRLIEAKGFGYKTQEEIKKLIEFTMGNTGKSLYAATEQTANELISMITKQFPGSTIEMTGELRRKCEIITNAGLLVSTPDPVAVALFLDQQEVLKKEGGDTSSWTGSTENNIRFTFLFSTIERYISDLFLSTGSEAHLQLIPGFLKNDIEGSHYASEPEIYNRYGLAYIEPELREGLHEISLAQNNLLPKLIETADLKGSLHNHSTWSDGIHTLEEMALYCKQLGYTYLGICDHSRSAFYANGLSEERVLAQHAEIEQLNKKIAGFHIFKGIESDILNDGALDYPDEILQQFDFVVASIHSNLKMTEEKANMRLLKAIENPYTTILGHPTGRLLLARDAYPINHRKIIDACSANGVVIEINANPLRLDLDWRWIDYALSRNVKLSINPDAHRKEGFADMYYGVCVARKGGLTKEMCLNSLSTEEIGSYFLQRKK